MVGYLNIITGTTTAGPVPCNTSADSTTAAFTIEVQETAPSVNYFITNGTVTNVGPFNVPEIGDLFLDLARELQNAFPPRRMYAGQGGTWEPLTPPSPEVRQRARRLLEGVLPPEAVLSWDRDAYIEIPSRKWPTGVWRLNGYGYHRDDPWIELWILGVKAAGVCLHVDNTHGLGEDALVAKYLLLMYDEESVIRIGNWSWSRDVEPFYPEPNPATPDLVFA